MSCACYAYAVTHGPAFQSFGELAVARCGYCKGLDAEVNRLRDLVDQSAQAGWCTVCAGSGEPANAGIPCVCQGTGQARVAQQELAGMVRRAQLKVTELQVDQELRRIALTEDQRQLLLLALALTVLLRPGWSLACEVAAEKLRGLAMYQDFIKFNKDQVRPQGTHE